MYGIEGDSQVRDPSPSRAPVGSERRPGSGDRAPPRFAPRREASFSVLDSETTGLDLKRDHVLAFGLVPVDRGRIRLEGALYQVVHPPAPPSPASIRVHGIRPSELERAPEPRRVAVGLLDALQGRTLVAHAAWIELGFLERLWRQHGRRRHRTVVDVLDLARRLAALEQRPRPEPSARLADLAARHGIPVVRTHHAFGDALLTAQLFLALATQLERSGVGQLRDLARSRSPWRTRPRRP